MASHRRLFAALVLVSCASGLRMPIRAALSRRNAACGLLSSSGLLFAAKPAYASKSRDDGYAVQRSDREWAYVLSGQQYFILRQGGTEQPNTSPLYKEKRAGVYNCAGCNSKLFAAEEKFNSGTGWPSFASALPAVEVIANNPILAAVGGTEVRCGTCGGHLGDVFADGLLFPGTRAAETGKRFCIDGGALAFYSADGSEPLYGEAPAAKPVELPSWLQPPKVSGDVKRAY